MVEILLQLLPFERVIFAFSKLMHRTMTVISKQLIPAVFKAGTESGDTFPGKLLIACFLYKPIELKWTRRFCHGIHVHFGRFFYFQYFYVYD